MKSFTGKMDAVIRRALQVLRTEGVRSLWVKTLGETVYRRAWIWERVFSEPLSERTSQVPVETSLLASSELNEYFYFRAQGEYLDFGSKADEAEVRRRLNAGQLCFVTRCQGQMVSFAWIALESVWIDYLAGELKLAPDDAFLYESYTLPGYRGRGIPTERSKQEVRYLTDVGYRRMIAIIVPENRAAVRHAEKAGWKPFGVMGVIKIGPWRRDFCRLKDGYSPLAFHGQRISSVFSRD